MLQVVECSGRIQPDKAALMQAVALLHVSAAPIHYWLAYPKAAVQHGEKRTMAPSINVAIVAGLFVVFC